MRPLTVQEALALPYDVSPRLLRSAKLYGPELEQVWIQSAVVSTWNGHYVPGLFNNALWVCIAAALAWGLIDHWLLPLLPTTLVQAIVPRRIRTFHAKHIQLAPLWGTRSQVPMELVPGRIRGLRWLTMQVPLRTHGLAIAVYVVANLAIVLTPYRLLTPNVFFPEMGFPIVQYLRAATDRTGIISFGATPLVVLLASRNSPFITLTGVSFSTLQIWHRWVARMVWLHAVLHSLGYTVMTLADGTYLRQFRRGYWVAGVAATCFGAVLCIASIRIVRIKAYETFLVLHVVGCIGWLGGCFYHIWLLPRSMHHYLRWIYLSFFIWAFDRLLRLAIILWRNPLWPWGSSGTPFKPKKIMAEGYLYEQTQGEFLRLRITPGVGWSRKVGGPGAYVFLSSPSMGICESHPFTVTWPTGMPAAPIGTMQEADDQAQKPVLFNLFESAEAESFELVLRKYQGFTKKLGDALDSSSASDVETCDTDLTRIRPVQLLVEGPYGHPHPLNEFDHVLLVAGGSGIASAVAHLAELVRPPRRGRTSRVRLLWSVRDPRSCHILLPYLERLTELFMEDASPFHLSVHIYVTGVIPSKPDNALEVQETLRTIESWFDGFCSLGGFTVRSGRPNAGKHIDELLPVDTGRLAVSVCGPGGLCDSTREAVRSRLGGANGVSVDTLRWYEDSFTW